MTSNRSYLLRAMYEWIADNGMTPYILVDAAGAGVNVPKSAIKDGRVVLNIAARAVAQLELGKEQVRFMARFSGVSQVVEVPMADSRDLRAGKRARHDVSGREPVPATGRAGCRREEGAAFASGQVDGRRETRDERGESGEQRRQAGSALDRSSPVSRLSSPSISVASPSAESSTRRRSRLAAGPVRRRPAGCGRGSGRRACSSCRDADPCRRR